MLKNTMLTVLLVLVLAVGSASAFSTEFYSKYGKGSECFMSLDYELYQGPAPDVWIIKAEKKLFERKYLREGGDIWRDARAQGEEAIPCRNTGTVSPAWLCPVEPAPAVVLAAPTPPPSPVFKPKTFIVYFDFDKDIIRADQEAVLKEAAEYAAEFGEAKIKLEASCDFRGSAAYNIELGERRATSVEHWLIENSVAPDRFTEIINHGDSLSPMRIMKSAFCPDCWEDRYTKIVIE